MQSTAARPFFGKTSAVEAAHFFSGRHAGVVQRQGDLSAQPEEEEKTLQEKPQETPAQRMCAECGKEQGQRSALQPKLSVGEADDTYEQEADRVADQVVDQVQSSRAPSLQP